MDIDPDVPVTSLLSDDGIRSVLAWYGLPVDDRRAALQTLRELCDANAVDVAHVLLEVMAIREEFCDADEEGDGFFI